ncbi:MAG TPA: GDSL-type esterase/lipase family protein [Candidatus Krumholzibacteria bacterium]|nr:GDSL-type esterase/lipase family protein [Candidatus Krumholzibacteria bacterium]
MGSVRSRAREFLTSLAVSAMMALLLLAVSEGVLRLFAPQAPRTEPLSGGSRAVPDSLLGHRYRPGSRAVHRTPEFTAHYDIGPDGLRPTGNPPPDSAAVRILTIGDSFTFGDCNDAIDAWVSVLERTLREAGTPAAVINGGVEGYDTRSELLYLRELAPGARPDVVVLGFLANDVYTNRPLADAPALSATDAHSARPVLHTVELAKRMLMQNDRMYARLFLLTARKNYYATVPSAKVLRQTEITQTLLGEMSDYCQARGMRFVVVSIPQQFAMLAVADGFDFPGIDPAIIESRLSPAVRASGALWIDTLPALVDDYRAHRVDLYYRMDGHLTPRGNRVVGTCVADALLHSNG